MTHDCDKLDDYLLGDLSDVDTRRFEAHLGECNECREAVDEQRWIDGLLQSSAAASLEPAPAAIAASLQTTLAGRRRTTLYVALCLATAATVAVVALGWTLQFIRQVDEVNAPSAKHVVERASADDRIVAAPAAPKPARATYANSDDTIAIDLESEDDDVTIVQLIPTMETERRAQRELALRPFDLELNGG